MPNRFRMDSVYGVPVNWLVCKKMAVPPGKVLNLPLQVPEHLHPPEVKYNHPARYSLPVYSPVPFLYFLYFLCSPSLLLSQYPVRFPPFQCSAQLPRCLARTLPYPVPLLLSRYPVLLLLPPLSHPLLPVSARHRLRRRSPPM